MYEQATLFGDPPPRLVTWSCPNCGQPIQRMLDARSRAAVCGQCGKRSALPESLRYRLSGEPELPGFERVRER